MGSQMPLRILVVDSDEPAAQAEMLESLSYRVQLQKRTVCTH